MKQRSTILLTVLLTGSFLGAIGSYAQEAAKTNTKVFYRYVNEQGVKVVAQTIPPQYVRAGYELVSMNGEVLKVVAASPSEKDAARIAQEKTEAKERARADLQLRRSYSTAREIDAAKERNLTELRSNIDLLKANLFNVKAQLKEQESQAATQERSGQKVRDEVLKNITNLRAEEKELNVQIAQRETEFQQVSDRYDQDKKRFIEINKTKTE